LGARYAPSDKLALGAAYRSRVLEQVEGTATSAALELPQELALGVAFRPAQKWMVEVGAIYTGRQSHDKFDENLTNASRNKEGMSWNDVMRYQGGAEYTATKALALRAGYAYEETPIQRETADYNVPDNDRHLFSLGLGYRWSRWVLDLSYTYIMILDRFIPARPADDVLESDFTGGRAQMIGVSLSTKL
jgi:long-chain fatty acid transport protein